METQTPPLPTQNTQPPTVPKHGLDKKFVGSLALYFILACALGLSVVFLMKSMALKNQVPAVPTDQQANNQTDNQQPDQNELPVYEPEKEYIPDSGKTIEVVWLKEPKEVEIPKGVKSLNPDYDKYYSVGTIDSGELKGLSLYTGAILEMGIRFESFTVKNDSKLLLSREQIKGISTHKLPEKISYLPNSRYTLTKGWNNKMFSDLKVTASFVDSTLGTVYFVEDSNCYAVRLSDGTALSYNIQFPESKVGGRTISLGGQDYELQIVKSCAGFCTSFISAEVEADELSEAGKTAKGDVFYALKDTQHKKLWDLYNDENTVAYLSSDGIDSKNMKYTYEQFLALKPMIFWKTSTGEFAEYRNNKFVPMAEICKPVIYLYPESPTALNVKVSPNGGIIYSDPQYPTKGWDVVAYPDGKIIDSSTGQAYEYLFWEGIGINYPQQKYGWVVAKSDVSKFLDNKLYELGLRGKEIADFKEYWVARLSQQPYYFISFLYQDEFNKIAPLEVSVQPAQEIRVMMTASGLNEYKQVVPQEFSPVSRTDKGFVLVEWGGALLK